MKKYYYFNERYELAGIFTPEEAEAELERELQFWNGNADEKPQLNRGAEVK